MSITLLACAAAAAAAKSLQLCPTLCDPIDHSPPGSAVPGILQARTLGCHFPLQCMKVKSERKVAQSCLTLCNPHGLQPTRLLHPWDFPGKSTRVGCHCLLCMLTYQLPNNIRKVVTVMGQQTFRKCIIHGIVPRKH